MSPRRLVIRTDASPDIGGGHFLRCLALAQAWRDRGGQVVFLTDAVSSDLLSRLAAEGIDHIPAPTRHPAPDDLNRTVRLLSQIADRDGRAPWAVLDGYHFDADFQDALVKASMPLLVVDDAGHLPHYRADIILNHNLYARDIVYPATMETETWFGPTRALLRREFYSLLRDNSTQRGGPRHILVTLGAGDPEGLIGLVAEAVLVQAQADAVIRVVIGPLVPNREALARSLAERDPRLVPISAPSNIPSLWGWADVVITAAGGSCMEFCFMGVPAVALGTTWNQRRVVQGLLAAKAAAGLADPRDIRSEAFPRLLANFFGNEMLRQTLAVNARLLVDGGGARRVARDLAFGRLQLRRTGMGDCEILWRWANDPDTRRHSFNPEPISWEEHVRWFARRVDHPDHHLYVALDEDGGPVGQIRFDKMGEFMETDVTVAPEKRGLGLGSRLVSLGADRLVRSCPGTPVLARVKAENNASARSFILAGFRSTGVETVAGREVLLFSRP